jgi:hypothetical protein
MSTTAELELDLILKEEARRKLEKDFTSFVRQAWEVVHPFEPLHEQRYLSVICEYLTAVRNKEASRLIVNQPPRTGKSSIISIMFPCWVWTTEPSTKFIFYTYSFDKLSVPFSVERRRLIQSPWYQKQWGAKFYLSYDENLKWMFSNSQSGRMTVLTGATGVGGNFLIIDDPHSVEEALSDAEREATVTKVRQGLMTRLDNPQSDSVVVVAQRLHDSDVSGAFLKDGGWTHLRRQAAPSFKPSGGSGTRRPRNSRKW